MFSKETKRYKRVTIKKIPYDDEVSNKGVRCLHYKDPPIPSMGPIFDDRSKQHVYIIILLSRKKSKRNYAGIERHVYIVERDLFDSPKWDWKRGELFLSAS
jgi:hypothetical protein